MKSVKIKNKKPFRIGMANRVRSAAKTLEVFSKNDLFCHIDQATPLSLKEEKSFRNTWDDLKKRKEIIKGMGLDGTYYYNQGKKPQYDVLEKIYRAMHVKRAFCAMDIGMLTDADQSYISAVIRKLSSKGWLMLIGKNEKHKIFRIVNLDLFYMEFVK